jgi:hypothetical protein
MRSNKKKEWREEIHVIRFILTFFSFNNKLRVHGTLTVNFPPLVPAQPHKQLFQFVDPYLVVTIYNTT